MSGTLRQAPTTFYFPAAEAASPEEDGQRIDLRALLSLVRRHRWTILITFACIVGGALLLTSQISKRYTATALVVVDSRDAQILGVQPGISDVVGRDSIVDTEVEIASSSTVLRRAGEDLNLPHMDDFAARPSRFEMLKSMIGLGPTEQTPAAQIPSFANLPSDQQAQFIDRLSGAVKIGRRGVTNVISISATLRSPAGASETANAVAEAYIREQVDAKLSANDRAASLLQARVEELAASIAEIDDEIDAFVTSKLAELGNPEARELLEKLAAEAKQREVNGATLADIEAAMKTQDYVKLAQLVEAEQAGLVAQRSALVQRLSQTSDQSLLIGTKATLDSLDRQIEAAAQRRMTTLKDEISLSNGLSVAFRRQIEATLSDVELPRSVAAELERLQREAGTRRTLYDNSLAKLRQVQQQSDFEIPDSRIIAYATTPNQASYPPVNLIILGAVFLGLSAGLGLAFLREHFIGGISNVEQLENLAQIPVVAGVPRYVSSEAGEQADMAIVTKPLSPFSEAVRRIQLGIDVLTPKGKRCIFVTSATPSEGKTTLAIALARQMASTGASTLLIDADMRHPTVHEYLNERVEGGLIGFLALPNGTAAEHLSIVKEAATGVSYVLGAPSTAMATDALLMSGRFDQLIRFARETYDVVIIDTPPIGLVVDAAIAARHCDIGIFVARYAQTNQHQVRASLRDLRRTDVPMVGVLNDIRGEEGYRYGKYQQYYGQSAA